MDNVDLPPFNVLSICSGSGMFDIGLRLAIPSARTVCYIEREAFPISVLEARIADKILDDAPIWSDCKTFDGSLWRGKVDCIIGGYPCQPFSVSGQRKGADDPRHLWPHILRIIAEVRPEWCFFENVEGHLTLGYDEVKGCLEAVGYQVAEGIFSAEEVGAPHRRKRLFILANAKQSELSIQATEEPNSTDRNVASSTSKELGHTQPTRLERCNISNRTERFTKRIEELENSISKRWGGRNIRPIQTTNQNKPQTETTRSVKQLGNSFQSGLEGRSDDGSQCRYQLPAWPPGREDYDNWRAILEQDKTIEPAIFRMVDGLDTGLDTSIYSNRKERLRVVGNGVVPIVAAYAFCVLRDKLLTNS